MQTITKQFNLKMTFKDGKVCQLERGDFGKHTYNKKPPQDKKISETSVLAWPVDPDSTGPWGILSMLGVPVADRVKFIGFNNLMEMTL